MNRRTFLAVGGVTIAGGGGGVLAARAEAERLVTTFKTISGLGLREKIRVLHLSDFHASSSVPWDLIRRSVELGMAEKPDLVLLTGDFITGGEDDFSRYPEVFAALASHPRCFACLGNHDFSYNGRWKSIPRKLETVLAKSNVPLLFNRAVDLEIRGSRIRLAGLGDLWCKEVYPERCLAGSAEEGVTTLLMAHNPDTKTEVANYHWDVMFSGHTHGGQIVVPVLGWRPILPVKDESMTEGIYEWNGRRIHITRGVGNLHGMRINCPPEVSLIDLA